MDHHDSKELQKLIKDRLKAEAKGRSKEVASLSNCIGELYSKYEQYEDAIVEHRKERYVSENINDDMGVAVACRKLGECFVSLEQFDKALPLLKQYLDLSKSCGEHNDVQRAWTTIGRMFLCQIESSRSTDQASRKAEDAFIKSLEVCEQLKSSIKIEELMDMKARSFLNLGCVYDIRGESNKSVEYFKRAISLAEKYRLYEVVYLCQINLSAMYERNGKVSEALRCLDVAINTSQKLKDKFKHSEALLQKAQLQISIGDYEASKHGLKKVKKLGLTRDADYIKMNKLYKAACKMKESMDDLETVDDPKYRIKLYDRLGDCAVDAFNYKQALVYYHKVLELGIDLALGLDEMIPIYVSLARTYADNKNYVEAIKYYKTELTCYKDDREQTARTWLNIADLEDKLKLDYSKIHKSYIEAFKAVRKTTNRKLQLAVLNSLAETQKYYKQTNHLAITEDKIKTLRQRFSSELDEISDEESQPIESNDDEAVIMSELSDSDDEDEGEETAMLTSITSNSSGNRCSRRSTFKLRKNEKGETPLHRACIENNLKKVKKLIEQGHPVNPRDNSGWIPLHEAANYNYYPIVEYLLDHGAHIDDRGGDMCRGVTPLIDAAENGNFETIELLVNRGANKLAKNDDGRNALDCLLEWKEREEDLDRDTEIQYNSILKLLHNGTGSAKRLYTRSPKPASASTQPVDSFIQYSSDEENFPDASCTEKSQRLRRLSALKKAPKALIAEDSEPENNRPDSYDSQEIYRSAILDDLNDDVQSATDNYRNAISLVRTSAQNLPSQIPKSAQKLKPSDQTESNALIGEDTYVGDDWLIDDVLPNKRKFRDCDGFMSGNTTRSASKTRNKRQRIDSDNDETLDLENLSDVAGSDNVSVAPDNHNDVTDDFIQIDDTSPDSLPTLPSRKSQNSLALKRKPKQTRLTSFGVNSSRRESSQTTFGRSNNRGNIEAWESDSSNSMDAASSIFGNNSSQSTNFRLSAMSAISSISSANPTGTQPMGSVMRLKVKVKDKVLLIPVSSSDQNNNINWLCQETSQRYFSLYGLRPLLTLSTIEGAIFSPDDIISMVLIHNDELTCNIDSWDLPPLHHRYKQACKTLNTVVYGNICNILQVSETSGELELLDLALRSTQLQPIFRALQGINNLTVFNLQGNRMGDYGVENLSKIFEAMPNLTSLNLACNNISSIGLKHIVDSIIQTTGDNNKPLQLLSSLNIKCNILGDSCIPSLACLVSSLPSLTLLNLSSCLLTSNCFQHHRIILANSLLASNLQELDVSYNKFGTLGVELLLKCLNNQKIRVLKLCHTQQGSSSSQLSLHLQQYISQSGCSLEELDISACHLSTDDLHFITRISASCPRIHKLTISKNNRITNQTLEQLLHQTVLEPSSKLDEIIANGCSVKSPLDTQFLDALSDVVNRESPLRYLSLTCDDLDKVDSDCVKQVWEEKWKNLSKINIQGNLIQLSVCESNS